MKFICIKCSRSIWFIDELGCCGRCAEDKTGFPGVFK